MYPVATYLFAFADVLYEMYSFYITNKLYQDYTKYISLKESWMHVA